MKLRQLLKRNRWLLLALAGCLLGIELLVAPAALAAQSSAATHRSQAQAAAAARPLLGSGYQLLVTHLEAQHAHLCLSCLPAQLTFEAATLSGFRVVQRVNSTTSMQIATDHTVVTKGFTLRSSILANGALSSIFSNLNPVQVVLLSTVGLPDMTMDNVNLIVTDSVSLGNGANANFHISFIPSSSVTPPPILSPQTPTPTTGSGPGTVPPSPQPSGTVTLSLPTPTLQPMKTATVRPPALTPSPPPIGLTPTPKPLPTVSPLPSPTPATYPLQVSPHSATLQCGQSMTVHVTNVGTTGGFWTVDIPLLGGLTVTPSLGYLGPGQTADVVLSNSALLFVHQGTLQFHPVGQATQPAGNVGYYVSPCL